MSSSRRGSVAVSEVGGGEKEEQGPPTVVCPQIMPVVFASLGRLLKAVASHVPPLEVREGETAPGEYMHTYKLVFVAQYPLTLYRGVDPEAIVELLLETLLNLQLNCPTLRLVYKSQQTIELFVQAFKSFVNALNSAVVIEQRTISMLEKMMHFGVTIAMDNVVAGNQKAEVRPCSPFPHPPHPFFLRD